MIYLAFFYSLYFFGVYFADSAITIEGLFLPFITWVCLAIYGVISSERHVQVLIQKEEIEKSLKEMDDE